MPSDAVVPDVQKQSFLFLDFTSGFNEVSNEIRRGIRCCCGECGVMGEVWGRYRARRVDGIGVFGDIGDVLGK